MPKTTENQLMTRAVKASLELNRAKNALYAAKSDVEAITDDLRVKLVELLKAEPEAFALPWVEHHAINTLGWSYSKVREHCEQHGLRDPYLCD